MRLFPNATYPLYAFVVSLFFLCIAVIAHAQTAAPCFEANITRGCAPLTVTMNECTNGGENIGYNFGDGTIYTDAQGQQSLITSEPTHTYDKPGIYAVTQYGTFNARGDTLRKNNYIQVLATPPPAFTAGTCQGRNVEVAITDTLYDSYTVNFGDGTIETLSAGQKVKHIYATTAIQSIVVSGQYTILPNPPGGTCGRDSSIAITPIQDLIAPPINRLQIQSNQSIQISFGVIDYFTYTIYQKSGTSSTYGQIGSVPHPPTGDYIELIENINTVDSIFTYKIVATDVCGNTIDSEEISSIPLTAVAVSNGNNLAWQTNTGIIFRQFTIEKNGQVLTQLANPALKNYADVAVECPDEYCYQVIGTTAANALSISNIVCVKAISADIPPPVQNVRATIEDGLPLIQWNLPDGTAATAFTLFRADNGGNYRELGKTNNLSFRDTAGNANTNINTYCYQVRYTDACGNTSEPSQEACPILLTKKLADTSAEAMALNWTAYQKWVNGVQAYVIEKTDEQGNVYEETPLGGALAYEVSNEPDTTTQVLRFRVKAILNGTPSQISYSNVIEIIQPLQIHLPTAFTPNDDGLNDVFQAKGLFINQYKIIIYNRWGEVVFASDKLSDGWDGKAVNRDAPAGTYVYQVETEDFTGRTYQKKGSFTLIR